MTCAHRRGRRMPDRRARPLCRLPQPAGSDGGGQPRRLVSFRRRGAARRTRPALFRRPQEGDHPPHGREYFRRRGRGRAALASEGGRGGGGAGSRHAARRRGEGLSATAARRRVPAGRRHRLLPAELLAAFKIPRFIEFRDTDFERTPSMRVQKQSLLKEKSGSSPGAPGTARPERSENERWRTQSPPSGAPENLRSR